MEAPEKARRRGEEHGDECESIRDGAEQECAAKKTFLSLLHRTPRGHLTKWRPTRRAGPGLAVGRRVTARHYHDSVAPTLGPVGWSRLLDRARQVTLDVNNETRNWREVIRSFRDRETEKASEHERSRRLPPDVQRQTHRKLLRVDAAGALDDLRVSPGNRLERLSGERKGQYGIRVNDQWRICFRWERGDAYDVEITDYH